MTNGMFLDSGLSMQELTEKELLMTSGGAFEELSAAGQTCVCVQGPRGMECRYRVDG